MLYAEIIGLVQLWPWPVLGSSWQALAFEPVALTSRHTHTHTSSAFVYIIAVITPCSHEASIDKSLVIATASHLQARCPSWHAAMYQFTSGKSLL